MAKTVEVYDADGKVLKNKRILAMDEVTAALQSVLGNVPISVTQHKDGTFEVTQPALTAAQKASFKSALDLL